MSWQPEQKGYFRLQQGPGFQGRQRSLSLAGVQLCPDQLGELPRSSPPPGWREDAQESPCRLSSSASIPPFVGNQQTHRHRTHQAQVYFSLLSNPKWVLLSVGSSVPRNDSNTRSSPILWLCCLPHVASNIITLFCVKPMKRKNALKEAVEGSYWPGNRAHHVFSHSIGQHWSRGPP